MPDAEHVNEPVEITREDLGLDHEPVNEIIGKQPSWIIRWGITLVFFSVIMILVGTWIIKYPDIVTTNIQVTTEVPPVDVVARTNGKLLRFDAREGDLVREGTYLAILDNAADTDEIARLQRTLERLRGLLLDPEAHRDNELEKLYALGDVQLAYNTFFESFYDYRAHLEEDFAGQKVAALDNQIARYEQLARQFEGQKTLLETELELARERLQSKQRLFEQELIPASELEDQKTIVLNKQYALSGAENNLLSNGIQIGDLRSQRAEIQQRERETRRSMGQRLQSAYKRLTTEFSAWEQRYVLTAPLEGRISLFRFWSPNQYVSAGEVVLTLVPDQNRLVGRVYLPQMGSGKVTVGQKVHIKLASFPFDEFGIVEGEIDNISLVAQQSQYLVNVALPNGLITSYGRQLEFKYNMGGTAEVITEDLRLIERIFNQLRTIFDSGLG